MPRGYPVARPGKPVLYTRITNTYAQDLQLCMTAISMIIEVRSKRGMFTKDLATARKRIWKRYRDAQKKLERT